MKLFKRKVLSVAGITALLSSSYALSSESDTINFNLQWNNVQGATHYNLEYKPENGAWSSVAAPQVANTYAVHNLAHGIYSYRVSGCIEEVGVKIYCGQDIGEFSNELLVNTRNLSDGDTLDFAAILMTSSAPSAFIGTEQNPVPDNTGAVQGNASVSGGAASYSIPIQLPPGRANFQPQVALTYSSRTGNGIAGVGWSISGGSSISRCASTYAQDGFTQNPNYSTQDKLCLDGQRLILTSGTYGTQNAEYRTEIESLTKVTQLDGGINGSSTSFKVEYADGRVSYYGTNEKSRSVHDGKVQAFSWLIEHSHDATEANFIHYEYTLYGNNERLLKRIYYTGDSKTSKGNRKVEFSYQTRTDTSFSYIAGGRTDTTQKLSNIQTFFQDKLVRKYSLTYLTNNSNATGRSLLQEVKECIGETNCLPETTFEWQHDSLTFKKESMDINSGEMIDSILPQGDINGDGARDWPGFNLDPEGNKTPNSHPQIDCTSSSTGGATANCSSTFVDINLDGYSDNVDLLLVNSNREVKVTVNNKNGSTSVVNTGIVVSSLSTILSAGDINGDSYPDLVIYDKQLGTSPDSIKIYYHTGNVAAPYSVNKQYLLYTIGKDPKTQAPVAAVVPFGDIDGNGLSDFYVRSQKDNRLKGDKGPIVLFLLNKSYEQSLRFESTPVSFETAADTSDYTKPDASGWSRFHTFADINGDGLKDWLGWVNPSVNGPLLYVRYNKGGQFAEPQSTGVNIETRDFVVEYHTGSDGTDETFIVRQRAKFEDAILVADIDNDGKEELIYPKTLEVEGCYHVPAYGGNKTICARDLYESSIDKGLIPYAPSQYKSVDSQYDHSIYRYEMLRFDGTKLNRQSTDIFGAANYTRVVDGQGDGLSDIVFFYGCTIGNTGSSKCTFNGGNQITGFEYGKVNLNRNYGSGSGSSKSEYAPSDMMISVTNGLNVTSSWDYLPLSSSRGNLNNDTPFYEAETAYSAGYQNFTSSMYVVSTFKQSNGVGGLNSTQYAYRGAVYNTQGRGFMGFKTILEHDVAQGVLSQSDFEQTFPKQGRLRAQALFDATEYNGKGKGLSVNSLAQGVFKFTENIWLENLRNNTSSRQIYLSSSVSKNFDS
ncbi:SpvB/TcaC N-terminal domain-containing protein [Pseudoalteromonas xiamenensis]